LLWVDAREGAADRVAGRDGLLEGGAELGRVALARREPQEARVAPLDHVRVAMSGLLAVRLDRAAQDRDRARDAACVVEPQPRPRETLDPFGAVARGLCARRGGREEQRGREVLVALGSPCALGAERASIEGLDRLAAEQLGE